MTRIFVDGAAGTVGMALQPHLSRFVQDGLVSHVEVLSPDDRKNPEHRQAAMSRADIVVLCLPDVAAAAAVSMAVEANPAIRILDASAAHRCADGWTYGLPEVTPAEAIARSSRVANPGCFATGCILMARPLHALLSKQTDSPLPWVSFQGITGYSAGGANAKPQPGMPCLAQLGKAHRHLPEIERYGLVTPSLTTMVGNWARGMLVQTTVELPVNAVLAEYRKAYAGMPIDVVLADDNARRLSVQEPCAYNAARLWVAEQPHGCTIAVQFDNLGKGSAAAAAENLRLMLMPRDPQQFSPEPLTC